MIHSTALNKERRTRELDELASGRPLDVLVLGGGVVGAGIALDAASRGLSVALAERNDLGGETSHTSSKLIHGGLRYLATGDISLAWESARERHLLMTRIAPHLIRPIPLLVPFSTQTTLRRKVSTRLGLSMGNWLRIAAGTDGSLLPAPRSVMPAEMAEWFPALNLRNTTSGCLFWDGQVEDDSRLVVALARTAAGFGARVITRCEATSVDPHHVTLEDRLSQMRIEVRPRFVINATGVLAPAMDPGVSATYSRGVHLLVEAHPLELPRGGLTIPVPGEYNRFIFALPWMEDKALIGVTDDPCRAGAASVPAATAEEIENLFSVLNPWLKQPLEPAAVIGSFAGVRTLVDDNGTSRRGTRTTGRLSRHPMFHFDRDRRMLTVAGGKLTTYRHMAELAMDQIMAQDHRQQPSATRAIALVGAAPRHVLPELHVPPQLARKYGTEAPAVLRSCPTDTMAEERVAGDIPLMRCEIAFAFSHEGALMAEDIVDRRSSVGRIDRWRNEALAGVTEQLQIPVLASQS